MKILFLTMFRIVEISDRNLYTDLLREFIRLGHEVYVATPSERRYKDKHLITEGDGYKILHVKTLNLQKTNLIEKGLGILLLEYQYKRAISKQWRDTEFDLILYSTPPITLNKVIEWQKKKGAITYLMLKDIFPQNAVDLGIIKKHSFLWKEFARKEQHLYELSDYIGCMSPANCQYLISNYSFLSEDKIEVCPNCIEPNLKPGDRMVKTKSAALFENNYPICLYGGNIGKPQGIDFIINVLDNIIGEKVNFCIVGSGTESHKLNKWITEHPDVKNVIISESLPKKDYDLLVSKADIGLIFLDNRFTIPNFPSRLLSYLESKIPVLIATDKHCDMGQIAEENSFGYWCESGDIQGFMNNLKRLISDPELRHEMGENGYRYLLDNYTVDRAAKIVLSHFNKF